MVILELVKVYKEKAKTDPRVLIHLIEQIHGKATQGIEGNLDFNIAKILEDLSKE